MEKLEPQCLKQSSATKIRKLITLGRKGSVNDKRKAYSIVNNTEITNELFNVVSKDSKLEIADLQESLSWVTGR